MLCRRAEEILDLVDKTSQELIQQEELVEGVVSIGSGELGAMEILADLCGSFREKYPRVRFDMYTATADVVRERMERGLIDIGLLLLPVDMENRSLILPRRLNVQRELANWFGDSFENLEIAFTGNLTTNDAMFVQKGYGCAVVIEGSLPFWDQSKVVSRPVISGSVENMEDYDISIRQC